MLPKHLSRVRVPLAAHNKHTIYSVGKVQSCFDDRHSFCGVGRSSHLFLYSGRCLWLITIKKFNQNLLNKTRHRHIQLSRFSLNDSVKLAGHLDGYPHIALRNSHYILLSAIQ